MLDQGFEDHPVPYVLQDMTPTDVAEVATLEQVCFSLPWSARAFDHEVRFNPMAHFLALRTRGAGIERGPTRKAPWTARHGTNDGHGMLVGYGGLWLIVDEGHICTLAVHPDWRRHGLGEMLLVGLIERATALGAAVATLEVRASNAAAQSLYEKHGFAKVGVRKGYYSDTHEDALIMTTGMLSSAAYQQRFQALKAALMQRLTSQP
jgi:ribosomal-protein-alanine N-acetyltransferase